MILVIGLPILLPIVAVFFAVNKSAFGSNWPAIICLLGVAFLGAVWIALTQSIPNIHDGGIAIGLVCFLLTAVTTLFAYGLTRLIVHKPEPKVPQP